MEYSEDLNFFLEHQIAVATTNGGRDVTFFSCLDGSLFDALNLSAPISDDEIIERCSTIHENLKN
jgi:hypothetical protein